MKSHWVPVPAVLVAGALVGACTPDPGRADTAHVSSSGAVAQADSTHLAIAALASEIEAQRVELAIPGVAVTVVTASRVLMRQGFGMRDVTRSLPVTSSTLFAIGSCTKPFTALAAAISQDAGVLSLDDHPRKHVPYFALRDSAANARVTLRDLLSHRTGVPIDDRQGWYERYRSREALIRMAMSTPPTRPLGRAFQYNNFMYVAAGEALAAAHHATYADVLRRLVFEPVGMPASTTSLAIVKAKDNVSLGYSGRSKATSRQPIEPARLSWLDGIEAAGAIWSSADDMSRWLRMLVGGGAIDGRRVVSDSGLRQLLAPAVRTGGSQYGLGWFIEEWHGVTLYTHAGGVSGFGARCEYAPALGLGWAVLTNVDDGELPGAIRELVYQRLARR